MSRFRNRSGQNRTGVPAHDRWLLSYADFVTLLLAVFIVLFASERHNHGSIRTVSAAIHSGFDSLEVKAVPNSNSHAAKSHGLDKSEVPRTPAVEPSELAHELQGVLGDPINKHEVVIQMTADGLVIRLEELGFFQSGEATLMPKAVQALQRTGRVLGRHDVEVRVEGHSDNQPIRTVAFHSNWELSTARAMSVLSVLINRAEFPPERIAVMGYGPYRPLTDNATEEGRRKNRRVDLVVLTSHNEQGAAR